MTRRFGRVPRAAGLVALLLAFSVASAQPADSLATADRPVAAPAVLAATAPRAPQSSAQALRRSLLVPGWGQVGNGQPVRAAVVVAVVAGATGHLVYRQLDYGRYRRAALFAGCREVPDRDVCADVAFAEASWQALGQPTFAAVRPVRDAARGQRDVAGLLVAVAWAAQALDAYVNAELAGFDVGEDLSVRATASPGGLAVRVRW